MECETEENAVAEVESIGDSTIKILEDNYTDVELGNLQQLEIDGVPAFEFSGKDKDKNGNVVAILSTSVVLGKTPIAEILAAVFSKDLAAAKETLGSFRPTGAAADELNLDFNLVHKTGYAIKEIYASPDAE